MMEAVRSGAWSPRGAPLPYDAEVEYLEGNGNQFIKVPGKISSTSRITVTFKYTGTTFSQFAPFGGGDGNLVCEASLISGSSSNGKWIYRCNNKQNLKVVNLDNLQVHTATWYKDGAILDGVDYPSLTTTNDFTPTRDYFGLFSNLRDGDNNPIFTMRGYIMSAQVYDNGVLVRDFTPVRKGSIGYMYDRVSGQLFGNAGTGEFIIGPDKTT